MTHRTRLVADIPLLKVTTEAFRDVTPTLPADDVSTKRFLSILFCVLQVIDPWARLDVVKFGGLWVNSVYDRYNEVSSEKLTRLLPKGGTSIEDGETFFDSTINLDFILEIIPQNEWCSEVSRWVFLNLESDFYPSFLKRGAQLK